MVCGPSSPKSNNPNVTAVGMAIDYLIDDTVYLSSPARLCLQRLKHDDADALPGDVADDAGSLNTRNGSLVRGIIIVYNWR